MGLEPPPGVGHRLDPTPLRTHRVCSCPLAAGRAGCHLPALIPSRSWVWPPTTATSWKAGRFAGADFPLQPDGTLRCPAGQPLSASGAASRSRWEPARGVCGQHPQLPPCPLREQCQWNGNATAKPRQVSVLLHPLPGGCCTAPLARLERREHRRACMQLVRHQRLEVSLSPPAAASPATADVILSRAQRAHSRLSWAERLARNARVPTADPGDDQSIRCPDSLCHLARFGDAVTWA